MNTEIKKLMSVPVIIILVLSTVVLTIPEKASAGFIYSVKIESSEDNDYTVDVGPDDPASLVLKFKVTNDGHNLKESIEVNVSYGSGIINVTASPLQFTLSMGESKTVTLNANIDREIEAPVQIPISPTVKIVENGAASSLSWTVLVKQFSYVVISLLQGTSYSLDVGSSKIIDIKLINLGNGDDPITFEVANSGELTAQGWTIPSYPPMQIMCGKTVNLSLDIKAPDAAKSGETNIVLRATSQLKNVSKYTQDVDLTVTVKVKSENTTPGISTPAIIAVLLIGLLISRRKGWPPKLWTKKSN